MTYFIAVFLWPAYCTELQIPDPMYTRVGQYRTVDAAVEGVRGHLSEGIKEGVSPDCRMEDAQFFIQEVTFI